MLFKDINKRFTEIVMEYTAKGYYFNVATMAGHQGEIGKVDLTDGKQIIRILIERYFEYEQGIAGIEGIRIAVGRVPNSEKIQPNGTEILGTIWNNHLEIITEEVFYQLGRTGRNGDRCYGTYSEACAAQEKQINRWRNKQQYNQKVFTEKAYHIVLPFVKRQPRCKSTKLADIEKVYSVIYRDGKKVYYVEAKGRKYKIG